MLLDANRQQQSEIGEDTWELFEVIERSFKVDLGDYFKLAGVRVSELAEKINALASFPDREKCLSAVAFYRLRRGLQEVCAVTTPSIRPTTPISDLLPWSKRRQQWSQLEEATKLRLPGLAFPGWLLAVCLILPVSSLAIAKEFLALPFSWTSLLGASAVLVLPMILVCSPMARTLPTTCTTVGDLAKALVAQNYAEFAADNAGSSFCDIQAALLLLVAGETGLAATDISPETRIPNDLNIY